MSQNSIQVKKNFITRIFLLFSLALVILVLVKNNSSKLVKYNTRKCSRKRTCQNRCQHLNSLILSLATWTAYQQKCSLLQLALYYKTNSNCLNEASGQIFRDQDVSTHCEADLDWLDLQDRGKVAHQLSPSHLRSSRGVRVKQVLQTCETWV